MVIFQCTRQCTQRLTAMRNPSAPPRQFGRIKAYDRSCVRYFLKHDAKCVAAARTPDAEEHFLKAELVLRLDKAVVAALACSRSREELRNKALRRLQNKAAANVAA